MNSGPRLAPVISVVSVGKKRQTWRSDFGLFCLAFVITFGGIMTNIAGLHIVGSYLERKQEQLSAPNRDDSVGPRLVFHRAVSISEEPAQTD